MKVGDLVEANGLCEGDPGVRIDDETCFCWFCCNDSSRIGIIIDSLKSDPLATLNPTTIKKAGGFWRVMFDKGERKLYGSEMISLMGDGTYV